MNALARVLEANHRLLNGSGKLAYFERRGLGRDVVQDAGIGFESGVFSYPSFSRDSELLGVHMKTEKRDDRGKRRQWWTGHTADVPVKVDGRPAKVIPFGLETISDLEPGSMVALCGGEEDALSLRQAGYTALSQPGAGLLEPIYAREFASLKVVVFYDAGEDKQARKDARKLLEAAAGEVPIVSWPAGAPNGADVNGRLVEDPETFGSWAAGMIASALPPSSFDAAPAKREGDPDEYDAGLNARNGKVEAPVGRLLSEVKPERVEWLWGGRVAEGKISVWEGDPGLGKSAATIDVAARKSSGRGWPDGSSCEAGGVVICSAEDGLADTIRPRLDAAGGDPSRVLALVTVSDGESEHLLSIPEDLNVVRRGIARVDAKLVIVDPLMAFLSGRHNAHKDQDVRRAGAALKASRGDRGSRAGGAAPEQGGRRQPHLQGRGQHRNSRRRAFGLPGGQAPGARGPEGARTTEEQPRRAGALPGFRPRRGPQRGREGRMEGRDVPQRGRPAHRARRLRGALGAGGGEGLPPRRP